MKLINIALGVLILVFIFLIVRGVKGPINFANETDRRAEKVIERLKDIRKSQVAYKSLKGNYASDIDDLIRFVDTAEFAVIKKIGNIDDTTAVIIRDTTMVKVKDSLFAAKYRLDSLKFIPYGGSNVFDLSAGTIKKGNVNVHVFEATAHYDKFLSDLDNQYMINLIAKKEDLSLFPGLKVGSMTEPSNAGNWE